MRYRRKGRRNKKPDTTLREIKDITKFCLLDDYENVLYYNEEQITRELSENVPRDSETTDFIFRKYRDYVMDAYKNDIKLIGLLGFCEDNSSVSESLDYVKDLKNEMKETEKEFFNL